MLVKYKPDLWKKFLISEGNKKRLLLAIFGAVVFVIILAVFSGTLNNNFVNFDDDIYVLKTPVIKLLENEETWKIFAGMHHYNYWHPVAWLSHAIDYSFYKLDPWGYHLTSMVIHAVTSATVFFLFISLIFSAKPQSKLSRNVLLAAFFTSLAYGLHPLRVEAVAWISERKELLGGFFYFCGLLTYIQFASAKSKRGRYLFYIGTLIIFCLGLMSKPHVVTFPAILLLLDWYPLRRFEELGYRGKVLLEKVPFFVLGLGFSVATMILQKGGMAIKTLEEITLGDRIWNAIRSLSFYIEKTLWPVPLVPLYPLEESPSWLSAPLIFSAILVISISYVCFYLWRKGQPVFLAAWAYYLMAIFPALGIVQIGNQAAADRFSYSTTLSFYILLGAGALWFLEKKGPSFYIYIKQGIIVLGVFILAFFAYQDNRQIKVWKDGVSLWTHVIKYYPERIPIAYNNLGVALSAKGNTIEAATRYREAIKLEPETAETHFNFGNLLRKEEYYDEAADHYKEAIRLKPDYVKAHSNLGIALSLAGKPDEAIAHYKEAIELDPNFAVAYLNLGNTLAQQGEFQESITYLEKALKNEPDLTQAHYILGRVLSIVGNDEEAEKHLNLAKELSED